MISIEKQQGLFLAITKRLKKQITVYAVGGTAMMFLGLKDSALDIDLVFETKEEKEIFREAIKSLGYTGMDATIIYGKKTNKPEMFTLGDERFNLFVKEVVDFIFSKNMQKRAKQIHQFKDKLIIKIADPNDIVLMKCATERLKDLDDIINIIKNVPINWELILNEAKNQKRLGKKCAIFELGYFLEKLKKKFKIDIPKRITNNLWDLIKEEAEKKKKIIPKK